MTVHADSALASVDRIEWHEGLLLTPQHFQAFSARLDALVAAQTLAAAPFAWGVRRVAIDHGLLPTGRVRVLQLDAIFPDGTAVTFDANDAQADLPDLIVAPVAQQTVDVYLTMPTASRRRREPHERRFRSVAGALLEDEVSDAPPAAVPRLVPNLALAAGLPAASRFVSLRLCTIRFEDAGACLTDRAPPLLFVPRDSALWIETAALIGKIRAKAAFLASHTSHPASSVEDRLAQLESRERLRSLSSFLPQAEAVLRMPRVHPLFLYLALMALSGPLSLLKPGGLPPVPADYDHDDPSAMIGPVLHALNEAITEVNESYREHRFVFADGEYRIDIEPAWCDGRMTIGLRGNAAHDLDLWMRGATIGSQSVYPALRSRRMLGAQRRAVDVAESLGIRSGSGCHLFEIDVDPAFIRPDEALIIGNRNEAADARRPTEVLLFAKA